MGFYGKEKKYYDLCFQLLLILALSGRNLASEYID